MENTFVLTLQRWDLWDWFGQAALPSAPKCQEEQEERSCSLGALLPGLEPIPISVGKIGHGAVPGCCETPLVLVSTSHRDRAPERKGLFDIWIHQLQGLKYGILSSVWFRWISVISQSK